MKAVVFDRYGPVDQLRLQDVTDPVPNSEQVRVAVRAASINPLDWHFLTGLPVIGRPMMGGVLRPATRRLGADLAGVVDAVGTAVTRFAPGDEVFGMVDGGVENQRLALGSCAEYVCVSQQWLERKPSRLTFEEAAAVPVAAITALQGLRDVAGLRGSTAVGQWWIRRRGHLCRATRQVLRCRGERGLQHGERRTRPLAGCRLRR